MIVLCLCLVNIYGCNIAWCITAVWIEQTLSATDVAPGIPQSSTGSMGKSVSSDASGIVTTVTVTTMNTMMTTKSPIYKPNSKGLFVSSDFSYIAYNRT